MDARRRYADASRVSLRALHRRRGDLDGPARRSRQRGRHFADKLDRAGSDAQVDTVARLQRRGFERPHLCRLSLPVLDRRGKRHGKKNRRTDNGDAIARCGRLSPVEALTVERRGAAPMLNPSWRPSVNPRPPTGIISGAGLSKPGNYPANHWTEEKQDYRRQQYC